MEYNSGALGSDPDMKEVEPWVIALDVMSPSGYVRQSLLNKDRFHLWYLQ